MCNLYSITKGQAAIIEFTRAMRDTTGNLPPLPGIFPDYKAPAVANRGGVRELCLMRWGMPSSQKALLDVVGIAYAAVYLAITRLVLASGPTLVSAPVFALALLVAPWLVMQPALGLGFMAAKAPHPSATRIINISGHAAFGFGLYLGAILIRVL